MQVLSDKIPILSELEERVKEISPVTGDQKSELLTLFRKALSVLEEGKFRCLQLLEMYAESDKEFNALYEKASEANLSECVNKLNEIGNKRKANTELKKAFESMGYRLMEQTRAGRRDDVFHSILRLYITCNQVFDRELLIAFKQPNTEMFKVLIFSFLSGIMETKK
jgi:hypothetical protein